MKRSMMNDSHTGECICGVPLDKNISLLAGELKKHSNEKK